MKRFYVVVLAMVIVIMFAYAACAAPVKIGISNCSDTDTFTKLVADTLVKMIEERHPDWEIVYLGAQMDSSVQISQVQALLAQGCNFICMSSADTAGSSPVLDECLMAGVPLINFVNPINGDPAKYTYVGGDNPTCGKEIAAYVAALIPENGSYVVIEGDPGAVNGKLRRDGCVEELAKLRPDVKLLESQTGNWEVEKSMQLTEDWLTKYGDDGINCIIGMNDNEALGAVEALKARGLNGKVIVTGCDGTKDCWTAIQAGDVTMSKFYNHVAQATGVFNTLEKLIDTGTSATDWVYTQFENVDKSNADDYMAQYYPN